METLSPNIYLVEDDSFYKGVIEKSLNKLHYKVKTFTNGADYLRAIEKQKPDLAIIDYSLGDTNGIALLEKTKSLNNAINVIILSAQQKLDIVTDAIKKGASFVHKDQMAFSKIKLIARKTMIDVEERQEERSAMIYRLIFFAVFTILAILMVFLRYHNPALFNNRD